MKRECRVDKLVASSGMLCFRATQVETAIVFPRGCQLRTNQRSRRFRDRAEAERQLVDGEMY